MGRFTLKPTDEQLRKMIVEQRMKLSDIGKIYGVRHSTVSNWKKALGIAPGIVVPFTKEDLIREYVENGKTQYEIADVYKVSQKMVGDYLRDWGIEIISVPERTQKLSPVVLTSFQEDLVEGMLLGDGHLRNYVKAKKKTSLLICEHSDRQKNYLAYKFNLLKPFVVREPYRYWRKDIRFKDGGAWSNGCYTRSHLFWAELRDKWYPEGKKKVPNDVRLSSVGLTFWYGDDGSTNRDTINLYTLDFSLEEVEFLREKLRLKYDLSIEIKEFDHKKVYYLHFDKGSTRSFMGLILEQLQQTPDLRYKVVVS